eukprot:4627030-Alexandrium_andersonii.AAC.1
MQDMHWSALRGKSRGEGLGGMGGQGQELVMKPSFQLERADQVPRGSRRRVRVLFPVPENSIQKAFRSRWAARP